MLMFALCYRNGWGGLRAKEDGMSGWDVQPWETVYGSQRPVRLELFSWSLFVDFKLKDRKCVTRLLPWPQSEPCLCAGCTVSGSARWTASWQRWRQVGQQNIWSLWQCCSRTCRSAPRWQVTRTHRHLRNAHTQCPHSFTMLMHVSFLSLSGIYRELCLESVKNKYECETQAACQHWEVRNIQMRTQILSGRFFPLNILSAFCVSVCRVRSCCCLIRYRVNWRRK